MRDLEKGRQMLRAPSPFGRPIDIYTGGMAEKGAQKVPAVYRKLPPSMKEVCRQELGMEVRRGPHIPLPSLSIGPPPEAAGKS